MDDMWDTIIHWCDGKTTTNLLTTSRRTHNNISQTALSLSKFRRLRLSQSLLEILKACTKTEHLLPPSILSLVIKAGVDIHDGEDRALWNACKHKDPRKVQLLIQAGPDVTVSRNLPLTKAIEARRVDTVSILLQHGADPRRCDNPFVEFAAYQGSVPILWLLVERGGADINLHMDQSFVYACEGGEHNAPMVGFLLSKGANVNACKGKGLELAALKDYLEIVRMLVEHGATAGRRRAAKRAYENGHYEVLSLLLGLGDGEKLEDIGDPEERNNRYQEAFRKLPKS